MIKWNICAFIFSFLFLPVFFNPTSLFASNDYEINNFKSEIVLQQDASLNIKETINVNFPYEKHGIFRIIPVTYTYNGKTIKAKFKLLSVIDEKGERYAYEKTGFGQSVKLKIGYPDRLIKGDHTYVINYEIDDIIQRYSSHDEVYWNVTGHEWDTKINSSSVNFISEFAKIDNADCFAGDFGTNQKYCQITKSLNSAQFSATNLLGENKDFSIIIALNNESALLFPGKLENTLDEIMDNWGYLVFPLPSIIMLYFWYKKGRDKKYVGDNIYYEPDKKKVIDRPLFAREYLPMVYSPIKGYSPSEIGTIVDEKVDIHDVVAELTELARLKYIKIEKLEVKKFLGKETDFSFVKLGKDEQGLADYHKYLLEKIFHEDFTSGSINKIEQFYKNDKNKLNGTLKLANEGKFVFLSALKNNFYKNLEEYKNKLYDSLNIEGIFDGRPDKVKQKWIGIFILLEIVFAGVLFYFSNNTYNFFPLILFSILSVPSFFLAFSMPRKTAKGYSIFRQIKGLAFYLSKGKWREEVAEKRLFFGEMLPLAIALGVVDKLAKEMEILGVKAPEYIGGVTTGAIYHDLNLFEKTAGSTLVSSPGGKWSGSSSWSGGSGFGGGGFSGGGFGGGGGGSW